MVFLDDGYLYVYIYISYIWWQLYIYVYVYMIIAAHNLFSNLPYVLSMIYTYMLAAVSIRYATTEKRIRPVRCHIWNLAMILVISCQPRADRKLSGPQKSAIKIAIKILPIEPPRLLLWFTDPGSTWNIKLEHPSVCFVYFDMFDIGTSIDHTQLYILYILYVYDLDHVLQCPEWPPDAHRCLGSVNFGFSVTNADLNTLWTTLIVTNSTSNMSLIINVNSR
jgi:hypothetical protein